MVLTVYCDEADDLREKNQPYFAYATVAIGDGEVATIIRTPAAPMLAIARFKR